jgi:hypothetical protein
MYTQNARFGDGRHRQTKLQRQRQAEPGSGKRRSDPSIHATSRPWHTSTPGIKMNVSTLGQIAARDKVAAKYLNQMNLSEMAQKKRGIDHKEEGRGYDKMGMAMLHGIRHSQGRGRMPSPNQDTIDRYQAQITGRIRQAQAGQGPPPAVGTSWNEHVEKLRGIKAKIPKRPYHVAGLNHHKYRY